MEIERYVVSIKLLGKERKQYRDKSKKQEYAIEVVLSDESMYTVYRSRKHIATFHHKLISKFPVEAGYFNDREKIIPDCPFKKTPFGIKQTSSDEGKVGRMLNSYLKGLSSLPAKMIKSDTVKQFLSLWATDLEVVDQKKSVKVLKRKESLIMTANSTISHPMQLKTYIAVANFKGQRFGFKKGSVVQVIQKDPKGWWLVDVQGELGWAPASFLVLNDEENAQDEEEENEALLGHEKVGARYMSTSEYKAQRDDELSFVNGAIVRVIKKYIDGWWLGRYNGHEGFIPGTKFRKFDKRQATAYVKGIKRKYTKRTSTIVLPTMKKNWQTNGSGTATETTDSLPVYECTSTFNGKSEKFEISLHRGDVVHVLEKKDNGWWYVRDWHGRSGWAPSSYLKDVHNESSPGEDNFKRRVGTECVVVSSFTSENDSELSVQQGDIVTVVYVSDDGWWMVRRFDDPDKQGLVPSLCLKDKEEEEEARDQVTSNASKDEPLKTNGAAASNSEEENSDDFDDSEEWLEETGDFDSCYVVKVDYVKKTPDEIDVREGEIAFVVDHTHKDVWYVEIDCKEGWIPSDILRPITEEELNEPDIPEEDPRPANDQEDKSPRDSQNSTPSSDDQVPDTLPCYTVACSSSDSDEPEEGLQELEKAVEEAERLAQEASEKAATLRKKAEEKRKSIKIESEQDKHRDLVQQAV